MTNYPHVSQPMPALPSESDGNVNVERLEEPYDLERHGVRSFLPRTTMARNSSIHTTPVIRTDNTGATVVSGLTGSTAQTSRELMLRIYTEKSSSHTLSKLDKVAQAAKEFVVGRIKFILSDRKFQSFWQPDLLTNTPSYVDSFFAMYGSSIETGRLTIRSWNKHFNCGKQQHQSSKKSSTVTALVLHRR
jgi:hypothetical protein